MPDGTDDLLGSWLIPACAGKTIVLRRLALTARAHPRVCGENPHITHSRVLGTGSSPRVRGKLCAHSPVDTAAGLIPACAGKTIGVCFLAIRLPAHPRVCGENLEAD